MLDGIVTNVLSMEQYRGQTKALLSLAGRRHLVASHCCSMACQCGSQLQWSSLMVHQRRAIRIKCVSCLHKWLQQTCDATKVGLVSSNSTHSLCERYIHKGEDSMPNNPPVNSVSNPNRPTPSSASVLHPILSTLHQSGHYPSLRTLLSLH